MAKEATNGWACNARSQREHREIDRLHTEIAKLGAALADPPVPSGPLVKFFEELKAKQVDLPADCAKILNEHFWDLVGEAAPPVGESAAAVSPVPPSQEKTDDLATD